MAPKWKRHWLNTLPPVVPPLHVLAEHVAPTAQALPQAPQLLALVVVSTHCPLHSVCPVGHAQLPLPQVCPLAQTLPQAPQLLASLLVFTQALPQKVCPAVVQAHAPLTQERPPPQTVPQVPQFDESVCELMHWLPHNA
jgi:hypothetical protein